MTFQEVVNAPVPANLNLIVSRQVPSKGFESALGLFSPITGFRLAGNRLGLTLRCDEYQTPRIFRGPDPTISTSIVSAF